METQPEHSLYRQIGAMRQALEDSKRPIGIFLGAGASSSIKGAGGKPLIPGLGEMTVLMQERFKGTSSKETFSIVSKQLLKKKPDATVEDYLTYIRSLYEIADKAELKDLSASALDLLDKEISKFVCEVTAVDLPASATPFDQLAIWARSTGRARPAELFTLNYDLLTEQGLERHKVPYFDGFIGSREAFFDPFAIEAEANQFPARWVRFWKLHGSVNWWIKKTGEAVEVVRKSQGDGYNSLIHPSHLKYDQARQMPYLAMLDRLKVFLQLPRSVLVLCGYSFRDSHINSLLVQALSAQPTSVAFALMRSPIEKYPVLVKAVETVPNLNVLAKDKGLIGGRLGLWLANEENLAIKYGTVKEKVVGGPKPTDRLSCTLGDFVELGKMLSDLTGAVSAVAADGAGSGSE